MLNMLPHDILILICVGYLDVIEIINLERTSKSFVELLQSRYLWLSLLQELDIDHAPELPHNVDASTLSSARLRLIVVQAVQSFKNWHRKGGPSYVRKVLIPKTVFSPEFEARGSRNLLPVLFSPLSALKPARRSNRTNVLKTKLVPGRRFIVLHRSIGTLELWDISKQALFATYAPFPEVLNQKINGDDTFSPVSLDFEMTMDEKDPNVVILTKSTLCTQSHGGRQRSYDTFLTVVLMNTQNSVVSEVVRQPVEQGASYRGMELSGDYLVISMQENQKIFVMNWRSKEKILIAREIEHDSVPRASVLHGHLIAVDENFVGKPYIISAIFLPYVFESISQSGSDTIPAEVNFKDLVNKSNCVMVPRMEKAHWDWRARRLAPYSLTFTNWKAERDRHIYIRLLVSDDEEVQVSTIKLHIGTEELGRPLLTVESTSPRVNTGANMRVRVQGDLKRMSSSGRVLLLEHYRGNHAFRSLHYAVFSALCWSSLWALSSQERFNALESGARDQGESKDLKFVPLSGQEGEDNLAYERLLVDEYGSTVYIGPCYSQVENIHIWYTS